MCSGDRNRSSVAESRSCGDTSPERRPGCKAGIMDLQHHHQFSPGAQVTLLLTLRPNPRNEGMCRPAPMKAPSPSSPTHTNTHTQLQASPPPPTPSSLSRSFCFILPHSSHASLFCSLRLGVWILPFHFYQGHLQACIRRWGPNPWEAQLLCLSESQFFHL